VSERALPAAPVALVISAATDPVAGSGPWGEDPVSSGLVAMKRAGAVADQPDRAKAAGARFAGRVRV
jgi:hypothetical protein